MAKAFFTIPYGHRVYERGKRSLRRSRPSVGLKKIYIFILTVIGKENCAALQQPQQKGVSGSIISYYHRYVTWTIAQIYKS